MTGGTEPTVAQPPDEPVGPAPAPADPATPDPVPDEPANAAPSTADPDPAPDPAPEPTPQRRAWARLSGAARAGLIIFVTGLLGSAAATTWAFLTSDSGGSTPLTIVATADDLGMPGTYMALPAGAQAALPPVVHDFTHVDKGEMKAVLDAHPAVVGIDRFSLIIQNPKGANSVQVEAIRAEILSRSAPYSGTLFTLPSQGSGDYPVVALDLDSADLRARQWDPHSTEEVTVGSPYLESGHQIFVDGGTSQRIGIATVATRFAYEYRVVVTLLVDGQQRDFTLSADGHGAPYRLTPASKTYERAYVDKHKNDVPAPSAYDLDRTPWPSCQCAPRPVTVHETGARKP